MSKFQELIEAEIDRLVEMKCRAIIKKEVLMVLSNLKRGAIPDDNYNNGLMSLGEVKRTLQAAHQTLLDCVKDGTFTAVKVGRRTYFKEEEVINFARKNRKVLVEINPTLSALNLRYPIQE